MTSSTSFKIVVFSNQNGLRSDGQINSFKRKVEKILSGVNDTPIVFLAAMKKNMFRKPMTGMWDWFFNNSNEGVQVDKEASFYVGDAAGRQDGWKVKSTKKDHSCGDRKFAQNIGIGFYTPEEYFLQEAKADFIWGGFDANEYVRSACKSACSFFQCVSITNLCMYSTPLYSRYNSIDSRRS
jgi:bifunctional polynucleotide phosphatase/kinase